VGERVGGKKFANLKLDKEITALIVIDPYNDFISEGGKLWDRLKTVAEANVRCARDRGAQKWLREPASLKARVDKWRPAEISCSMGLTA
jgi:hypothetical protein